MNKLICGLMTASLALSLGTGALAEDMVEEEGHALTEVDTLLYVFDE